MPSSGQAKFNCVKLLYPIIILQWGWGGWGKSKSNLTQLNFNWNCQLELSWQNCIIIQFIFMTCTHVCVYIMTSTNLILTIITFIKTVLTIKNIQDLQSCSELGEFTIVSQSISFRWNEQSNLQGLIKMCLPKKRVEQSTRPKKNVPTQKTSRAICKA